MIIDICLIWIGMQLNAPDWYFWLIGFCLFINIISFGWKMFKRGKQSR